MMAFGLFLITSENKEITLCTIPPLQWIVTDCVRNDTAQLEITAVLTGVVFGVRMPMPRRLKQGEIGQDGRER